MVKRKRFEIVGSLFSKSAYLGNLHTGIFLLGTGFVLPSPVQATATPLPNLICATTISRPETLALFKAGKISMALVLPIQRQGQRVKTFNVHLHAKWVWDPSQQAETIASDMRQKCLVVVNRSGEIKDTID